MAETKPRNPQSLSGLLPFLRPYRGHIALAALFLLLAAGAMLAFPVALRGLIDGSLAAPDRGARLVALREHFLALFGIALSVVLLPELEALVP